MAHNSPPGSSTPEPATRILKGWHGEYALIAEHGRGGFAVTHRGRRLSDGLPVVIKTVHLAGLGEWKSFDHFERESAVLRNLDHPGIPAWLDHFPLDEPKASGSFALVQRLVEGRTLAEAMRTPGALSPTEMLAWFEDLLGILEYLHGRSPPVIHRDVTPKNVILRPDGGVSLVDFGSVQAAIEREGALATTSAGTFGFAAPEQFMCRSTPASDLYGAAMTFLAVSTGRDPTQMPIDGLRVNVPAVFRGDARLARLLSGMTETDPRVRVAEAAAARRSVAQIRRAPASTLRTPEDSGGALTSRKGWAPVAFMNDLRSRLMREEFVLEPGGQIGATAFEFRARRGARRWEGLPAFDLYVAAAEGLDGHLGNRPLSSVPIVLLAKRAGALHAENAGALWSPPRTVVTLVVSAQGMAPHAAARVESALVSNQPPVLVAAVASLTSGSVDLMIPAGAWGEAHDVVRAYLSALMGIFVPQLSGD